MKPGADNKNALVLRIFLFDGVVDAHRAVEVLGIEPSSDIQDGMFDVIEMLEDILSLPVVIIVTVLHVLVPGRYLLMKI